MNRDSKYGVIVPDPTRPEARLVEGLARFGASEVADAVEGTTVMDAGIKRIAGGDEICGTAITVDARPGSLLFIFKSFEFVREGDVLVVAGSGRSDSALFGSAISSRLKAVGCRGVIVDGAVRDVQELNDVGLPVFARAATPAAFRLMEGPGSINAAVQCGGVTVEAGDIVRANLDGVVVVPAAHAAEALGYATAKRERPLGTDEDGVGYPPALRAEIDAKIEQWRLDHPLDRSGY
jgi:4-hydroxy-4-methyl-2-oxoglutarate aldolase